MKKIKDNVILSASVVAGAVVAMTVYVYVVATGRLP